MAEEVSARFAAALAIKEKGRVVFGGAAGDAAISKQPYAVGRLLSRKAEPKAVIGTLMSVWGLKNRLQMRAQGDRFVMKFDREEDRREVLAGGPWFFNRTLFAVAAFDGLCDPAKVPILSFPVDIEILGLPPALLTKEAVLLIGSTLGEVIEYDELGIRRGTRAKVRVHHKLCDPIRQAFPPAVYEFGSKRIPVTLSFKYERTYGFCRTCGLLEHLSGECGGPPDFSEVQVIGGGQSGPSHPNPNLSMLPAPPGFGMGCPNPRNIGGGGWSAGAGCSSSDGVSISQNPFTGGTSQFLFSIPGVSATDLATKINKFRTPFPLVPAVPSPVVLPVSSAAPVGSVSGLKRNAFMDIQSCGKRNKSMVLVEECLPLELPFVAELSLPHKDGVLLISPQKKRLGRPKGSKNRPKVDDNGVVISGPQRPPKRKFGRMRQLEFDEDEAEVLGGAEVVGVAVEGDPPSGDSSSA